jgi:hypothetical protein
MKEPIPLIEESEVPRLVGASRFSDLTKAVACLLFLAVSAGLWLSIHSSWAKALYYLLFLIPNYACGEWLGSKIFSQQRGLSISESGFSVLRVLVGVIFVLLLFGLIYGLAWLGKLVFAA